MDCVDWYSSLELFGSVANYAKMVLFSLLSHSGCAHLTARPGIIKCSIGMIRLDKRHCGANVAGRQVLRCI